MSLENQVVRVSQGTKDTLKALINMMGGNITDELIDQYPAIASQLLPPTGITGKTVTVTAKEQLDAGNMIVILQNGPGYDAYKATNESLPTTNFWLGISKDTVQSGSVADVTSIAYMDSTCNAVIEQNKSAEQKFWVGTDAEYKAIAIKDPNTMYLVTDDCGAAKGYITEAEYTALLATVNGKANAEHTHIKSQITDFAHSHEMTDVNGLNAALGGKASTTHASTHAEGGSDPLTLSIGQVSNLQNSLDSKANASNVYTKTESDTLLSTKPGQNLLDNSVFLPGCLVDQRQGRVVIPNTTYYSDNQLTTAAGTTSAYVTAYRYTTGTASGVSYASFKLTDTDAAPTYYAAPENVVRGYTGAGYGPDRWTGNAYKVLLINDDCITFKNTTTAQAWFGEWMDNLTYLNNREFTLSILYRTESSNCGVEFLGEASSIYRRMMLPSTDGKWNIASITIPAGSYFGSNTKARWGAFVDNTAIGSIDIKGFGVELGTEQTLAHQDADGNWVLNELPNYGEQLARCQRYLQKLVLIRSFAVSLDANGGYLTIQLPVAMRASPTITPISLGGIIGSDKSSTITEVRTVGFDGHNLTLMFKTSTTMAGNTAPVGYLYDTNVWLSADL